MALIIRPTHPPYWSGQLASTAPIQDDFHYARASFLWDDYTIQPRASFRIQAVVLGTKRYRRDPGASLSPVDLALGWGPMSDHQLLRQLNITQSRRFFWVKWDQPLSVSRDDVFHHAANIHAIPSSEAVFQQLRALKRWSVVELDGMLVDAARADGFQWRTSMTREDIGGGACELLFVESVRTLIEN
jgi:hypothetical protein